MEIFLCARKDFWLNSNNLALPINVLKKKSITIFPAQKSMPSGVNLHLQKVLVHPRISSKTAILCNRVQGDGIFQTGGLSKI